MAPALHAALSRFSCVFLLLVLSGCGGCDSATQVQWPESAAARLGERYVQMWNAADGEGFEKFAAENFTSDYLAQRSPEQQRERFVELRERLGALTVVGVRQTSSRTLTVYFESENRGDGAARFMHSTTEPIKIFGLQFEIGTVPEDDQQASDNGSLIPDEEIAQRVDEYFSRLEKAGFSGGLCIAHGNTIVLKSAYGFANRKRQLPFTTTTVTTTGSLTKQFIGAAAAQLIAEGKISLNDPLPKFFDGVPQDKADITVRHLLSHTSGLPDAGHDHDMSGTREHVLAETLRSELLFPPGGGRRYSNAGFSLAAMIIEKVTGMPHDHYLRQEFWQPLAMKMTGYVAPAEETWPLAIGYRNGEVAPTFLDLAMFDDGPTWFLRGSGGVLSTVDDMAKWYLSLRADGVMSAEAREAYLRPLVGTDSNGYGYGWGHAMSRRGTHMIEHDGGNGIFNADLHWYADEDVAIYVVSSVAEIPAERAIDHVESIIFGHESKLPPRAIDDAAKQAGAAAGTYRSATGDFELRPRDALLIFESNDADIHRVLLAARSPAIVALADRTLQACLPLVDGDLSGVREELAGSDRQAMLVGGLEEMLGRGVEAFGPLQGVKLLGVSKEEQFEVVVMEMKHEQRSVTWGFAWKDGRLAAFEDGYGYAGGSELTFIATDADEFSEFTLDGSGSLQLKISADGRLELLTTEGRLVLAGEKKLNRSVAAEPDHTESQGSIEAH